MMTSLTIRNLDDAVKARLRVCAAQRGRSMEKEARHILRDVLDRERPPSLADLALEMFGPAHGVELYPHREVRSPSPPEHS